MLFLVLIYYFFMKEKITILVQGVHLNLHVCCITLLNLYDWFLHFRQLEIDIICNWWKISHILTTSVVFSHCSFWLLHKWNFRSLLVMSAWVNFWFLYPPLHMTTWIKAKRFIKFRLPTCSSATCRSSSYFCPGNKQEFFLFHLVVLIKPMIWFDFDLILIRWKRK